MKTQRFIALAIMASGLTLAAASADAQVKVSVGYADTLRNPAFTPTPWLGTAGVIFIGSSAPWDAGAILLDNPSANALTVDDVKVELGAPFGTFDIWGPYPIVIPGKGSAVLTQTTQFNFDTSDMSTGICSAPSSFKPVVRVTVGVSTMVCKQNCTTSFIDADQVLITGGLDVAACTGADEGQPFQEIHAGRRGSPIPPSAAAASRVIRRAALSRAAADKREVSLPLLRSVPTRRRARGAHRGRSNPRRLPPSRCKPAGRHAAAAPRCCTGVACSGVGDLPFSFSSP